MVRRKRAFCPGTALPDWPFPDKRVPSHGGARNPRAGAPDGLQAANMLHPVIAFLLALDLIDERP
jgi:hypothetical protein